MQQLMDYPWLVFALSLVVMWFSAQIGAYLRRKKRDLEDAEREYVSLVLPASLTLLGLLIGFSFSMAVSRSRISFETCSMTWLMISDP